jgi:hypothetical protein
MSTRPSPARRRAHTSKTRALCGLNAFRLAIDGRQQRPRLAACHIWYAPRHVIRHVTHHSRLCAVASRAREPSAASPPAGAHDDFHFAADAGAPQVVRPAYVTTLADSTRDETGAAAMQPFVFGSDIDASSKKALPCSIVKTQPTPSAGGSVPSGTD